VQIYRLADGELDEKEEPGAPLLITNLKQGVKNPNRVNIFVDGKYSFSLDVAQVVDFGVKVGQVLSETELEKMKRASEFGKAYQRALEWVLVRPRSVGELRDYLKRREMRDEAEERKREWQKEREIADLIAKGEDANVRRVSKRESRRGALRKYDFTDLIVERLCERGYVDDRKFAAWYVENRFVKKGVSRKRLKMELVKKGVGQDVIEEVLGGRDDEEEIRKMVVRKRTKYTQEKLIAYLCRQGFSYDLVRQVVSEEEDKLA
jgi:regulatory protein